jgi:predicted aspartyl protease
MKRQMFLTLLALASSAALAAQPATTKLDAVSGIPKMDSTTQTEDVKFKSGADDRMTVPVRLSGSGPYRFLVDTGADRTAVSRDVARRLGLAQGAKAAIHTVSGISTVSTATVPELQLTNKPVKITDAPLLDSVNMGADGIIGVDALRSQSVLFDFDKGMLSIVPSAVAELSDEPDVIVIQVSRKNGRLIVTDAVANGHKLTVVVDTGAQLSMGNLALRDQLLGRGLVDENKKVALESVTGDLIDGDYMFIRKLEIGGVTLTNLAIVFTEAHTFKELKLDDRPALLLGMNAMRAFKKVSIDFANHKFRVVLPETGELDNVRLANARLR